MNELNGITFDLKNAPLSYILFYRSYGRTNNGVRENPNDVFINRTIQGLKELGDLNEDQINSIEKFQSELKVFVSGRSLFSLGTQYAKQPKNFYSQYNCSSIKVEKWEDFGLLMNLAMQGCGTGAIIEEHQINKLPAIKNQINLQIKGTPGDKPYEERNESTIISQTQEDKYKIIVGDSREGWVEAYQTLLELSSKILPNNILSIEIEVDISNIRPSGEPLKGFGGVANPVEIGNLFHKCVFVLNKAIGRKLNSIECCLLIDEAAKTIVAGNIRRCLSKNTLVTMADGTFKSIEDIKIGDKVQGLEKEVTVIGKEYQGLQEIISLNVFKTQDIICSHNHKIPILKENGSYKLTKAIDIKEKDKVYAHTIDFEMEDLMPGEVEKETIVRVPYENPSDEKRFDIMYDIEVEGGLFFANGILVSNSAGMRQGSYEDENFTDAKSNLWICDKDNNWKIDPERDALRMANHTRILKKKPEYNVCLDSITKQFYSGEGAVENALEAIARCNIDILNTTQLKKEFIRNYNEGGVYKAREFLKSLNNQMDDNELNHRLERYGLNPCFVGSSRLLTQEGYKTFNELKDKSFKIISSKGKTYKSNVWCSGKRNVIKLITSKEETSTFNHSSLTIECTPDHKISTTQGVFEAKDCLSRVLTPSIFSSINPELNKFMGEVKEVDFNFSSKEGWVYVLSSTIEEAKDLTLSLKEKGFKPFITLKENNISLNDIPTYQVILYRYVDLCLFYNSIDCSNFKEELKNYLLENAPLVIAIEELGVEKVYDFEVPDEHWGVVEGIKVHNCGEIIGSEFLCNLSEVHLNNIDGLNIKEQKEAFEVGGLIVGILLNHKFIDEKLQRSRELDPIVGVSFTGLFDFFIQTLGIIWLNWWKEDRDKSYVKPSISKRIQDVCNILDINIDLYKVKEGVNIGKLLYDIEKKYFHIWKESAFNGVYKYCDEKGLKKPNRCTTVQPAGSKSLLTGASSGWHPPKGPYFIRRITFRKEDPIALAAIDFGYKVIPSQNSKDDKGNLLKNPFDERVNEWLIEVPVKVKWADIEGIENIEVNKLSAKSQWDFYMNIQREYSTHNTSGTIEFSKEEIETLSQLMFDSIQKDAGYISVALLQRFNDYFPFLPMEPINKEQYDILISEVKERRKSEDFHGSLQHYTDLFEVVTSSPQDSACEGVKCELRF